MVNVVCLKWGTKYSAEYVNKLAAMVRRNLKRPHRFMCLTEDTTGIDSSIECLPLLDDGIKGLTGWWHKLSFFRPKVHDLKGPTLFLDLDVVITGPLDPFFEQPGDFVIIKDWAYKSRKVWNSSVFRLEIGKQAHVYKEFIRRGPEKVMASLHGDQNFISEMIPDAALWPADWCVSYKYHCCVPKDATPHLPEGARVLVFHGKPDPHEAISGEHRRYKAAPWLADYWHDADLPPAVVAVATVEPASEPEPAPVAAIEPVLDRRRAVKMAREAQVCRSMIERLGPKGDKKTLKYYKERLKVLVTALGDA